MSRVMLDTSAVMAYVKSEPGAQIVEEHLLDGAICAVNLAELVTVIVRSGESRDWAQAKLDAFNLDVIEFDHELAMETGALIAKTKPYGLSLGDRACLAAGIREGIPVMTAERSWGKLDLGIDIQLIR